MRKVDETSGKLLFEEREKFPRWMFVLILLIMLSTIAITIGASLAMGNQSGSVKEDMWIALALTIPVEGIIFYLFTISRLEKIVTSNGLYYRWLPLQKKFRVIEGSEIEKVAHRKAPTSYGSSWVPGYGKVHNLSKEGLQCYLESGKKYFFGTGESALFHKAMDDLLASHKKIHFRES